MRFCKQLVKSNNDDVIGILNCLQSHRARSAKLAIRSWSATGNKARATRLSRGTPKRRAPALLPPAPFLPI